MSAALIEIVSRVMSEGVAVTTSLLGLLDFATHRPDALRTRVVALKITTTMTAAATTITRDSCDSPLVDGVPSPAVWALALTSTVVPGSEGARLGGGDVGDRGGGVDGCGAAGGDGGISGGGVEGGPGGGDWGGGIGGLGGVGGGASSITTTEVVGGVKE